MPEQSQATAENQVQIPVSDKEQPALSQNVLLIIVVFLVAVIVFLLYQNNTQQALITKLRSASHSAQLPASRTISNANFDTVDKRVTNALSYGAQQSALLPIASGSARVSSALYASQFGSSSYGESGFVNITLHNTTSNDQIYNMNWFSLQLPNGVIKQFSVISGDPPINDSAITVATGGKAVETLVFENINTSEATVGIGYLIYTSPVDEKISKIAIKFKTPWTYTD